MSNLIDFICDYAKTVHSTIPLLRRFTMEEVNAEVLKRSINALVPGGLMTYVCILDR